MDHVASIVHLTDLHLFVDPFGDLLPPTARTARLAVVRRFVDAFPGAGMHTARGPAWEPLSRRLPDFVTAEADRGAVCIVAQTGDVEAFGKAAGGWYGHAAVAELRDAVTARTPCVWSDVYGNHDVWPGAFVPEAVRRLAIDEIADVPAYAPPWSPIERVTATGLRIMVHRINTVIGNTFAGGVLAQGGVGPHPIQGRWDEAHAEEAVASLGEPIGGPTLGVGLLHHPPHAFDHSLATSWNVARLRGAETLARATGPGEPLQLIVGGHRHEVDPPIGGATVSAAESAQAPLRPGSGQVVSDSPTIHGAEKNHLTTYRLFHTAGSDRVDVHRVRRPWSTTNGFDDEVNDGPVLSGLLVG